METIKLCIIEDEVVVRESLESFFGEIPGIEIRLIAGSVEDFLAQAERNLQLRRQFGLAGYWLARYVWN